jgi:nucleoside-diphosphate kinase
MVKPDAVSKNLIGEVLRRLEAASLKIIALRMTQLTQEEARKFYYVHRERPFFEGLIKFICSGPVVAMALEGEDAVSKTRALMGATNPKDAAKGTLRGDFGAGIEENVIHGSDAKETAITEIAFFFDRLP